MTGRTEIYCLHDHAQLLRLSMCCVNPPLLQLFLFLSKVEEYFVVCRYTLEKNQLSS